MSAIHEVKTSVKIVGANGQISLGKGYAGRQVLVEEQEPGVWLVRTALVIPENERWLHDPKGRASLQSALEWAARDKPRSTDLGTLFEGVTDGKQPARQSRKAGSQQPRVPKKPA
ncbi:MAG: hypothetical protein AB7P37_19550 [Ramlibacter sp.]